VRAFESRRAHSGGSSHTGGGVSRVVRDQHDGALPGSPGAASLPRRRDSGSALHSAGLSGHHNAIVQVHLAVVVRGTARRLANWQ
jgi:hypothetical protein